MVKVWNWMDCWVTAELENGRVSVFQCAYGTEASDSRLIEAATKLGVASGELASTLIEERKKYTKQPANKE